VAAELVVAPEAEQDIADAYAWYEEQRPGLGEEFLSCVDACLEAIRRTPEMHAVVFRVVDYLTFMSLTILLL
jgi:hypothetical protein